jgi:hypothetical protein
MSRSDVAGPAEMLLGDFATILTDPEIVLGERPKPMGRTRRFSGDVVSLLVRYFPQRDAYAGFTRRGLPAS